MMKSSKRCAKQQSTVANRRQKAVARRREHRADVGGVLRGENYLSFARRRSHDRFVRASPRGPRMARVWSIGRRNAAAGDRDADRLRDLAEPEAARLGERPGSRRGWVVPPSPQVRRAPPSPARARRGLRCQVLSGRLLLVGRRGLEEEPARLGHLLQGLRALALGEDHGLERRVIRRTHAEPLELPAQLRHDRRPAAGASGAAG